VNSVSLESLRYPIGRFEFPESFSEQKREENIEDIQELPTLVKQLVTKLSAKEMLQIYRPDGWNSAQLVNHLIDSHSNAVIRFKLALTEENPIIRPYAEERWALLADTQTCPLDLSLQLLDNLHKRWIILIRSIKTSEWQRTYFHPDSKRDYTLYQALAQYAWHGKHHLAHIELAKNNRSGF
jgi:hypothetical protein